MLASGVTACCVVKTCCRRFCSCGCMLPDVQLQLQWCGCCTCVGRLQLRRSPTTTSSATKVRHTQVHARQLVALFTRKQQRGTRTHKHTQATVLHTSAHPHTEAPYFDNKHPRRRSFHSQQVDVGAPARPPKRNVARSHKRGPGLGFRFELHWD